ncbi:MAG: RNA 2'-phosphotransferase, partial [Planctomycetes bacterium]|nr:RNA 2'-phosphotransferase [Planctomycetota bacterium]
SHALRHAPEKYFLIMDSRGAVDLECFLLAIRYHRPEWASLTVEDIHRISGSGWNTRFEISGTRIRALYGHSVPIYYAELPG